MPTQKNTKMCEELITKHCPIIGQEVIMEKDPETGKKTDKVKEVIRWPAVVLDPFMGAGTTAVAAHNTGRNVIGCEIREEMYDQMIERIEGELENDTTILYGTRQREAAATV